MTMALQRFRSIGRLIPLLIAVGALTDLGSRLLPLAWFSARLEEPSRRYPIGIGDFTPGFHYDMPRAYGDLANFAGDPALRFYRRECMRVDQNGFRLDGTPAPAGKPPECVLFGDSFAAGVSLCDDSTLPSQFSARRGRTMFDASSRLDWGRVRRVIEYLGMQKGTVVLVLVDRDPLPPAEDFQDKPPPNSAWYKFDRVRKILWNGYWEATPLQIVSERLIRRLQNNRYLPNPVGARVRIETLKDERPFLFLDQDVTNFGSQPEVSAAGLFVLQDRLRRRGLDLFVVLVPDKYLVYHRLIKNAPPEPARRAALTAMKPRSAGRASGSLIWNRCFFRKRKPPSRGESFSSGPTTPIGIPPACASPPGR